MKKIMFRSTGLAIFSFVICLRSFAQAAVTPPPPAPKVVLGQPKNEQSEIVIRQKDGKDTKITLEIKNGDVLINGKPIDKFEDKNIIVEKRNMEMDIEDGPLLSYSTSPFREHEWEGASMGDDKQKMQMDKNMQNLPRVEMEKSMRDMDYQRNMMDMQRNQMQKTIKIRTNEAFLGVSSHKTETGGATVLEVTKGSPAEKAGIKKDDIITKVNDTKIVNPENLFETIHNFKPGDKVKVIFKRAGKEQTVIATLDKSEPKVFSYNYNYKMPPMPDMGDMGDMGMGNMQWRMGPPKLGIKAQDAEDGKGVNLLEVEDSSVASKAGLKKGDIILQFDGKDVNSANELVDQYQDTKQKPILKVKYLRGGVTKETDLKIPRKLKTAEL